MAATAKLNKEYAIRMLGIGALMLGMACWSLYDGQVGYPRINARYEAIRPQLVGGAMTAGELIKSVGGDGVSPYERAFQEQGIKTPHATLAKLKTLNEQARNRPVPEGQAERFREQQVEAARALIEMPLKSGHDIQSQFVMAALAALAALAAGVAVGRKARRRFTADEAGLHGFTDAVIAYPAIASADWTKWEEKRIVRFILTDGRRIKLDGWHFTGAEAVVDELLRHRPEVKADSAKPTADVTG